MEFCVRSSELISEEGMGALLTSRNVSRFVGLLLIHLLLLLLENWCSFILLVLFDTHDLCVFAILVSYINTSLLYLEILLAATEAECKT